LGRAGQLSALVWQATRSAAIEHRVDPDFVSTRTYPRSFGANAIAGGSGAVEVEIRL
jgi:hypothetical protein